MGRTSYREPCRAHVQHVALPASLNHLTYPEFPLSAHHDDVLEDVFLRRRSGIQALKEASSGVKGEGSVAVFPVAVKLAPNGGGDAGRLYPLVGLSHEPGSVFEPGITKVTYAIKSPTAGMRFEIEGCFHIAVSGRPADMPPAAHEVVSGSFPAACGDVLPGNIQIPVLSEFSLLRRLHQIAKDGERAWERDFFAAVKPMMYRIVGEMMPHRHPLKVESTDEWGKALETVVKGGIQFASPERTSVSWTNWANRNIRRDIVREQDKRTGRSHADQSAKRFALARRPTSTDAEIFAAADDLYEEWKVSNAYREAKKTQPSLDYDEFAASLTEPLHDSSSFSRDRFKRALEPAAVVVSIDSGIAEGEVVDLNGSTDLVIEGRRMVDAFVAFHRQMTDTPMSAAEIRTWLVRRGVIEAVSEAEALRSRLANLDQLEARFFEPWQQRSLRWSRRTDRHQIREAALRSMAMSGLVAGSGLGTDAAPTVAA